MSMCQKCWKDAGSIAASAFRSKTEVYSELIEKRKCTSEEQAGRDAGICSVCDKKAVHEITGQCMNCHELLEVEA